VARKRKKGQRINGRLSRAKDQIEQRREEARKVVQDDVLAVSRQARARRVPPELRAHVDDPMCGCPAGRAIMTGAARDEWSDLWQAVGHMRRTFAMYDRVFGRSRYAKVAAILAPTEAMATHADAPAYDDRTDREKQDAATNAWMHLHGWMGRVSSHSMQACIDAVIHQTDDTVRDPAGMLACLRAVSLGLKGA